MVERRLLVFIRWVLVVFLVFRALEFCLEFSLEFSLEFTSGPLLTHWFSSFVFLAGRESNFEMRASSKEPQILTVNLIFFDLQNIMKLGVSFYLSIGLLNQAHADFSSDTYNSIELMAIRTASSSIHADKSQRNTRALELLSTIWLLIIGAFALFHLLHAYCIQFNSILLTLLPSFGFEQLNAACREATAVRCDGHAQPVSLNPNSS